jgi:ubiquinone/menaquinone biosynthesis C-methylase UbiE
MFTRVKKTIIVLLRRYPKLNRTILGICANEGRHQKSLYLSLEKNGDYVIDIGANIGNITLLLSNIVGKRGRVFSYEAVKSTYEKLLHDIKINSFYNKIAVFNLAVGNDSQEILITVSGDDYEQHLLV